MLNDHMKTIKENEQLHISSGVYEDNTTLREYDFVVVNDREDSPIGAVWLGIFRDENNPKEKWQLESHVFLRENCKAEELFEKHPNISYVLNYMDVVVSDGISLTTAPRPAQYFALGKLPYNTGKSSKTSDDFLSPSEAQKDIEYWRDNFMVGPKVAHTTNAIFGVLRKLKHDQRQEMTEAEVNSLLAIAEKGPTSRKIG